MKRLLITLVMVLAAIVSMTANDTRSVSGTVYVYVCTGPTAKCYHVKPDCPSNCSGEILRVSLEEATTAKYNYRRPCGKCCHPN